MARIDETISGGRYLGADGRYHDSEGRIIEVISNDLPADFPARQNLVNAGVTTLAQVQAMTDEEIRAIEGIGNATLAKIRAYGVTE